MLNLITTVIAEQNRKIDRFMEARSTVLEQTSISGKVTRTTLTIDTEETEAVDALQGMKMILSRYKEELNILELPNSTAVDVMKELSTWANKHGVSLEATEDISVSCPTLKKVLGKEM